MTHVLRRAVSRSRRLTRAVWIVVRRGRWVDVLKPRRGDRVIAQCCGAEVLRGGF